MRRIKNTEKAQVEKLIKTFLKNNNLTQYSHSGVIYIDDISPAQTSANIRIYSQEKVFEIRVYLGMCRDLRDVFEFVIHELTHLYLYELNDLYEFLVRNKVEEYILNELVQKSEEIVCKLAQIFISIYLNNEL